MHDLSLQQIKKEWHGTVKAYLVGFFGSLVLTAASFLLVITKWLPDKQLLYALIALALAQAAVQLRFFLHVGEENKPRWETVIFYFMLLILLIIAIGSLWIMNDLNNRVMMDMPKETLHD